MIALLCVNIDRFRLVNDQHGRSHGDELLKTIAARLSQRMRKEDTVARIGGDAFLVVLPAVHDLAAAARPAQDILQLVSMPIAVQNTTLDVTASMGMAIWPRDAADPEQLILHADQALHQAKQAGRNQYRIANPAAISGTRS